jgi:hypothetical protein
VLTTADPQLQSPSVALDLRTSGRAQLALEPYACMSITTISLKDVPSIWKA